MQGRVDAYPKIIFNYKWKLVCVTHTYIYNIHVLIISRHCFTATTRHRPTDIYILYNVHVYTNKERTSHAKQFWRIVTVSRRVGGYNKRFYSICNRVEKTFPKVFSLRKKRLKYSDNCLRINSVSSAITSSKHLPFEILLCASSSRVMNTYSAVILYICDTLKRHATTVTFNFYVRRG